MNATKVLVPCVTGKSRLDWIYDVALCSPSIKHPRVYRGKSQTIVDCHTYYLRSFARHKTLQHMVWYASQIETWASQDESFVFVVPDVKSTWLAESIVEEIVSAWARVPSGIPVLVVPGTPCALVCKQNIVGHALTASMDSPVHPEWVHSFSRKTADALNGVTKRWTYDHI